MTKHNYSRCKKKKGESKSRAFRFKEDQGIFLNRDQDELVRALNSISLSKTFVILAVQRMKAADVWVMSYTIYTFLGM